MTPEAFARLYADVVFHSAIASTVDVLTHPPGRRPAPSLAIAAAWWDKLDPEERAIVERVIAIAAHAAAFGALAMIDGVRPTGPDHFEIVAVDALGNRAVVDASGGLHDLFQGLVMGPDGALLT